MAGPDQRNYWQRQVDEMDAMQVRLTLSLCSRFLHFTEWCSCWFLLQALYPEAFECDDELAGATIRSSLEANMRSDASEKNRIQAEEIKANEIHLRYTIWLESSTYSRTVGCRYIFTSFWFVLLGVSVSSNLFCVCSMVDHNLLKFCGYDSTKNSLEFY